MAGFGRAKFGRGPFGKSDVGRNLIVSQFPIEYLEDGTPSGQNPVDNKSNPLLMMLNTYANSVSKRRKEIDAMKDLINYEKAPADILLLIGDMLGLGIDKNDPDFLKRSFVGNASQWLQVKSTDKGYQVRGLASGFTVAVDNFWRIDESLISYFPARHVYFLKPVGADSSATTYPHVDVPPGSYAGTSAIENETYAKSSYVRIVFEVREPRKAGVDYNTLLDLIIDKIKDVVAIHHEMTAPQFLVNMNSNNSVSTNWLIDEAIINWDFNEFNHFDIVAADEVPCDQEIIFFFRVTEKYGDVDIIVNSISTILALHEEAITMDGGLSLSIDSFDQEHSYYDVANEVTSELTQSISSDLGTLIVNSVDNIVEEIVELSTALSLLVDIEMGDVLKIFMVDFVADFIDMKEEFETNISAIASAADISKEASNLQSIQNISSNSSQNIASNFPINLVPINSMKLIESIDSVSLLAITADVFSKEASNLSLSDNLNCAIDAITSKIFVLLNQVINIYESVGEFSSFNIDETMSSILASVETSIFNGSESITTNYNIINEIESININNQQSLINIFNEVINAQTFQLIGNSFILNEISNFDVGSQQTIDQSSYEILTKSISVSTILSNNIAEYLATNSEETVSVLLNKISEISNLNFSESIGISEYLTELSTTSVNQTSSASVKPSEVSSLITSLSIVPSIPYIYEAESISTGISFAVGFSIQEEYPMTVYESKSFDLIPADIITPESGPTVTLTAS